jgi:hypothetical protein
LGGLVHRVDDAEVVFGVLEVGFGHHAVAGAGGVAAQLEVFLEEMLGSAADAQVWAAAVEDVVAVERDVSAAAVVADLASAAAAASAAASTASAAAAAKVTSSCAFHVHKLVKRFPVFGRCPVGLVPAGRLGHSLP